MNITPHIYGQHFLTTISRVMDSQKHIDKLNRAELRVGAYLAESKEPLDKETAAYKDLKVFKKAISTSINTCQDRLCRDISILITTHKPPHTLTKHHRQQLQKINALCDRLALFKGLDKASEDLELSIANLLEKKSLSQQNQTLRFAAFCMHDGYSEAQRIALMDTLSLILFHQIPPSQKLECYEVIKNFLKPKEEAYYFAALHCLEFIVPARRLELLKEFNKGLINIQNPNDHSVLIFERLLATVFQDEQIKKDSHHYLLQKLDHQTSDDIKAKIIAAKIYKYNDLMGLKDDEALYKKAAKILTMS